MLSGIISYNSVVPTISEQAGLCSASAPVSLGWRPSPGCGSGDEGPERRRLRPEGCFQTVPAPWGRLISNWDLLSNARSIHSAAYSNLQSDV